MKKRYASILETIGRTPIVKIDKIAPQGIDLFVKVESFNPGGSVKDRLALGVIEDAERRGALRPGQTVVAPRGSAVLCMLPDTGERYLTTTLFETVPADMTPEELTLSASTPSARFDVSAPAPPEPQREEAPATITPEADAFVSEVIESKSEPVVMFALEWCEFCWSIRKMFAEIGLPYRSVDLDSAENQESDWGGQVRAAVSARTGMKTIPQVFVSGEFIGGCTETFDAFKEGVLQDLLTKAGVELASAPDLDPYEFLPSWLHAR